MKWLRRNFIFSLVPGSILTTIAKAEPSTEERIQRKLQRILSSRNEEHSMVVEGLFDLIITGQRPHALALLLEVVGVRDNGYLVPRSKFSAIRKGGAQ